MLALKLFGGAVLEDAAGFVSGSATHRHPMALLALLATAPSRTLSRSKLVGYLWPESTEKKARNRLNTSVHQIRSEAGEDVLVSVGDDLRLNTDAVSCDVCRFEAAIEAGDHATAVALYVGPFLDGFHLGDSPPFEKWLDGTRDRLRRNHLDALESLATVHAERGDSEAAARCWRERAEADPYDSRVTKRLMRALAEAGNRPAALRVARRHARRLEEEFGTEPDPEIRELADRLRGAPDEPAGTGGVPDVDHPGSPGAEREGTGPGVTDEAGDEGLPVEEVEGPLAPEDWLPSRLALGAFVAIGLLAAAAVAGWYLVGGGESTASSADRTVAVLPFETEGPGASSFVTEGIFGAVLTRLSTLSDLTVVSPTTGRDLGSMDRPLAEAARELGINWIVTGDVVEDADGVEVDARLVDARTDEQVWTESYRGERTAEAVFGIQSDITGEVVAALQAELTPEEERRLQEPPTENSAAYELYLQARELDRPPVRLTEGRVDQIVDLHRRALELDPEFAEAWAWLADAYVVRAWAGQGLNWADSAVSAVRRALELDPDLAAAYAQLGDAYWAMGRAPDTIIQAYRKALELRPNDRESANNLLTFLARRGRLAEKMEALETMHRTSPGDATPIAMMVETNAFLGRDSVARAWLAHGRERGHELLETELWLALVHLGDLERANRVLEAFATVSSEEDLLARYRAALAHFEGDWADARRRYRRLYTGPGPSGALTFQTMLYDGLGLAHSLDRLGSREEAREIAREVVGQTEADLASPDSQADLRHRRAVAELVLGDTAAALDWLERAVDLGYRGAPVLRSIPVLEPLRDHPRFQALLARVDSLLAEERRLVEENGWGIPPVPGS